MARRTLLLLLALSGCTTAVPANEELRSIAGTCKEGELTCGDGTCITTLAVCNGVRDCTDGLDETRCAASCQNTEFQCADNACIPTAQRCDGTAQCATGEDEVACDAVPTQTVIGECPLYAPYACDGGIYDCTDDYTGLNCYYPGGGSSACPSSDPYACPRGSLYDCTDNTQGRGCGASSSYCPSYAPYECPLGSYYDCTADPYGYDC